MGTDWWRGAWLIAQREVRDQVRDWRIVLPVVGFTLFFPLLMNFTAQQLVHFVARFGAHIVAERMFPFLMMVVGFFPSSISLVVALESFVGERERRTIEPLLAAPLTDAQLYVGKLIAVLFLPLTVSYLGVLLYVGGLHFTVGWHPAALLLGMVLLLTTVQAVVMVCAAVVISTQATSVRSANLLASLIIVPVALLLQWESLMMFWRRYNVLWVTVAGLAVLAVFTSRLGLAHFNRENLLGRDIDVLNVRWLWQQFWGAFRGEATSVGAWYREVWQQDILTLGWPLLLSVMLLLVAGGIGAMWVARLPLPPVPHTSLEELRASWQGGDVLGVPLVGWQGTFAVWWHNVRAMLLAALGAAFSFGVVGVVVPMLPYAVIGGALAWFARGGWIPPLVGFVAMVLPHGIVEIPATALFMAATLRLGAALAAPHRTETLGVIWLRVWGRWWRVFLGFVVPLMGLAAVLETHLTPRVVAWLLF